MFWSGGKGERDVEGGLHSNPFLFIELLTQTGFNKNVNLLIVKSIYYIIYFLWFIIYLPNDLLIFAYL